MSLPVLLLATSLLATSLITVPTPPGLPSTDITAHHGQIYQTKDSGVATPGFVEIDNTGAADVLTGAKCPLADTTTLVDAGGRTLEQVEIPAHQSVRLTETGPHLLLQNTHFSVDFGGVVPCSLILRDAGTISVFLYARPAP